MSIFLDTSIANRILDLKETRPDVRWEQDRVYLNKLLKGPVARGAMIFLVNPTVMSQIRDTPDSERRRRLVSIAKRHKFTEFNMAIFPFSFPARLFSKKQKDEIESICSQYPSLISDQKILADAAFGKGIDVLLTTDRELVRKAPQLGWLQVMLPRDLWEYFQGSQESTGNPLPL
jgi:hypothetical protein